MHDGDDMRHNAIMALATAHPLAGIRVRRAVSNLRLGGLRTLAIERAQGDWICQWDDDDRYHPARLQMQWDAVTAEGAAVNYLADQLHWFRAEGLLCWDDWDREPYPMNFIQGTILARRDILPPIKSGPPCREDRRRRGRCCVPRRRPGLGVSAARRGLVLRLSLPRYHLGRGSPSGDLAGQAPDAGSAAGSTAAIAGAAAEYEPKLPPLRIPVGTEMRSIP